MSDSEFDPSEADAVRALLQARLKEIAGLVETTREARATVDLDQTKVGRLSRIDALQGQQMALATDRRQMLEMQRIDAALARLEAGDYGYCVRCDGEIAAKRLALDPAAPLCIDCAERA